MGGDASESIDGDPPVPAIVDGMADVAVAAAEEEERMEQQVVKNLAVPAMAMLTPQWRQLLMSRDLAASLTCPKEAVVTNLQKTAENDLVVVSINVEDEERRVVMAKAEGKEEHASEVAIGEEGHVRGIENASDPVGSSLSIYTQIEEKQYIDIMIHVRTSIRRQDI